MDRLIPKGMAGPYGFVTSCSCRFPCASAIVATFHATLTTNGIPATAPPFSTFANRFSDPAPTFPAKPHIPELMNQTIPPPKRSAWSKNRIVSLLSGIASAGLFLLPAQSFAQAPVFVSDGLNNTATNVSVSGGAYFTGSSAGTDSPASAPLFSEGTHSRGVANGSATITSNAIDTTSRFGSSVSFDLASFSIGSSGNGADGGDTVSVAISPDNGVTYFNTLVVAGNNNARWSFTSGTGVASTAYDGDVTPAPFAPTGAGNRTTDGYSKVIITGLPQVSQLRFRITMLNDAANERWFVDNIAVSGYEPPAVPATPTASAITTTSFTANWDAVVDALSYKLDVATDSGFTSFVSGYENLTVTGTSQIVSGLNGSTTYYARLRSVGAGDATSASSATLTVTTDIPVDPFVGVSKTTLTALTTTYGTPSAADTFLVNGSLLTGDITITAPSGLEVSQTSGSSGFAATQVLDGSSGTVSSASIWVRLKADATVSGSYNGLNVTLASPAVTSVNVATAASGNAVSPKSISVTGLTAAGKTYDANNSVTVTGTPSYTGLENGESFAVTGSPTWAFETKTAGIGKSVIATGSFDAPSSNYTVTNPVLSADIEPLAITVTGASVVTRPYDGTTTAQITGATPVGVLMGDTVTVEGGGTFATPDIGTGISVTANLTLGGTDGGNYTLTQPTGLTGEITLGVQTITFAALPNKFTTDAPFELTATSSSGLPVSYISSDPLVATVSGSTLTIVGEGTTLITASQAGDSNYGPATSVSQNQLVLQPPTVLVAGDIAVIAYQADNPDQFAFLTMVDINPGTRVSFTDNGWNGSALSTNENTIVWEAPLAGVEAGTVVTFADGVDFSVGAKISGSFNGASTSGDQLLVYQGTAGSPTFIYGLSTNTWITTGSPTSNQSYLPSGLVNGVSARDFTSHQDNSYFTAVSTTGTQEEILAAIGNVANWTRSNTRFSSLPTWSFTIGSEVIDPLFTDPTLNAVISDQPAGVKRLSFTGIPGRVYGIQRSDDLTTWTQIDTVTTPPGGAVTFDDPSPLPGKGFYRIIFPAETPPL